jgi:excisionase family DNA binding protein
MPAIQQSHQQPRNETARSVARSTPTITDPKIQSRASEIERETSLRCPKPTTAPLHDTLRTLRFRAWAAPSGSGRSPSAEATAFPGVRRPIVARLRRATAACRDARENEGQDRCELLIGARPMQTAASMDNWCVKRNTSTAFLTERSLAAYLAVSDRTIRNWIRRGELPTYKLGAARRIDPADVEDFLARHRDEAA